MRIKKIIVCILIAIIIFANAAVASAVDVNEVINKKDWNSNADDTIKNIGGNILAVMQVIGATVAIVMLIVVAIKYMTTAPNDKAEIKKYIVPYIVGAIFVFAAIGIIQLLKEFFTNIV